MRNYFSLASCLQTFSLRGMSKLEVTYCLVCTCTYQLLTQRLQLSCSVLCGWPCTSVLYRLCASSLLKHQNIFLPSSYINWWGSNTQCGTLYLAEERKACKKPRAAQGVWHKTRIALLVWHTVLVQFLYYWVPVSSGCFIAVNIPFPVYVCHQPSVIPRINYGLPCYWVFCKPVVMLGIEIWSLYDTSTRFYSRCSLSCC